MGQIINDYNTLGIMIPGILACIAFVITTLWVCWDRDLHKFSFHSISLWVGLAVASLTFMITFLVTGIAISTKTSNLVKEHLQMNYSIVIDGKFGTKYWAVNKMPDEPVWLRYADSDTYLQRYLVVEGNKVVVYKADPEDPTVFIAETPKPERD